MIGAGFLLVMVALCVGTLPWTLGRTAPPGGGPGAPRYDLQYPTARHLPPSWWGVDAAETGADTEHSRLEATARRIALERLAEERSRAGELITVERLEAEHVEPTPGQLRAATPSFLLGTDLLGRSLLVRCLAGGGVSLGIGLCAAGLSVLLGTLYGAISGYAGGRIDAVMMRTVDVLYGLPYILLVVLLAVAVDAGVENWQASRVTAAAAAREAHVTAGLARLGDRADAPAKERLEAEAMARFGTGELGGGQRQAIQILTLLVAIGGVSWLTMARVVRGQVLSLKRQPFIEAARATGVPVRAIFLRHLLPNLVGPITVYATLTVPQAILQESFLSFLGIGVRPPMPSWGNLAADGLVELNPYKSHWWLLVFPCLLLGTTLLALNFVGEGLREALDPKRGRR
jgi:ABC-type dipeptide/oligopeptide/nickel transport system permease subunit